MSVTDDASDPRARAPRASRSGTDSVPAADVPPRAACGASRPAPRGRRRRRGDPELYYVGRRRSDTPVYVVEVYVVDGTDVHRLAHRAHNSDEAFDWGHVSPGALELAYAVLADCTARPPTDAICQVFCSDVVAALDPAGFVLGRGEIASWLRYGSSCRRASELESAGDTEAGPVRRAAARLRHHLHRP